MTDGMNDIFTEDPTTDGNIPQPFQDVQKLLDQFAVVGYDATYNALQSHSGSDNADYLRNRIVTILRDNPPFATIPKYLRDGQENYLWYSDFYDDAGKDVFRRYNQFSAPAVKITPANYAGELNKVGLPYFEELVNLVSLEKLYVEVEARLSRTKNQLAPSSEPVEPESIEPVEEVKPVAEPEPTSPQRRRLSSPTRSYEPKMSGEQLSLLAECINTLGVFVEAATEQHLTDLLAGKQPRLFHITNQKQFTYLFDNLRDGGYITKTWIAVAGYNCDFASSPQGLADDSLHFITSQQFTNCRRANRSQAILGMNTIDEMMERFADQ